MSVYDLIRAGSLKWNDDMIHIVGPYGLCKLINAGIVTMRSAERIRETIAQRPEFYRPDMDEALGTECLSWLIKKGAIPYSQRLGEKLPSYALSELLMHDFIKYEPHMRGLLHPHEAILQEAGKIPVVAPIKAAPQIQMPEEDSYGIHGWVMTRRNLSADGSIWNPAPNPPCTGRELAERVAYGTVKWIDAWANAMGQNDLYWLIKHKHVPYASYFDKTLGPDVLLLLIFEGHVEYEPHMQYTLEGLRLKVLIEQRKITYAPHMDEMLGADRLCNLIVDGHVEYEPRMDELLGGHRLVKITVAYSRRAAAGKQMREDETIADYALRRRQEQGRFHAEGGGLPSAPPPSVDAEIIYPGKPLDNDPKLAEDDPRCCILCFEREIRTVMLECNHSYACISCIDETKPTFCAICRKRPTRVISIYKS